MELYSVGRRNLIRFVKFVRRTYWTSRAKLKCKSYGEELRVNYKCHFTKNTVFGSHDNFNGMKIQGEGIVRFGNYFHSGEDCRIITDIHNFDFGTEIPYDSTKIVKDVIIGDFVWIGTCVIILGGVEIGEGAIIQAVLLFLIFRRTQLLEELQQRYLR